MTALRLLRTARHLRPIQIVGRAWFRLYRPRPELAPPPEPRRSEGQWSAAAPSHPSLLGPSEFRFLGVERSLTEPGDWNNSQWERLWIYNLHYFEDLVAENAAERKNWHQQLIGRWIRENPPGKGPGWEPYPLSLRIINWIKWLLAGNLPVEGMLESLAIQTRWLTRRFEYHIQANHLLENARALTFAGTYFGGRQGDRWLRRGLSELERELDEQMLSDGSHYERSPMYHSLLTEGILDLVNLSLTYPSALRHCSDRWQQIARKALLWLAGMTHPDGEIGLFNDAAFGIAKPYAALNAYAARLGCANAITPGAVWSAPSGYGRLENGRAVTLLDAGNVGPRYQPGHAHAQTLSFELSVGLQRIIVNSGTSLYGVSTERQRQRGTAAHSTVCVDQQDSSEVWGGFRVGRRARVLNVRSGIKNVVQTISAEHDGYRYLPGSVIHNRTWQLERSHLLLKDHIQGSGEHLVEATLYFHPDLILKASQEGQFSIHGSRGDFLASVSVELPAQGYARLLPSTWHPGFGTSIPNQKLVLTCRGVIPMTILTKISWPEG